MLKSLALSSTCAMVLAGFAACGNDDSGGSSTPSTPIPGVAGTTQVSQLTPAQQEQAAKDLNAYWAANITPEMSKQSGCGMLALMAAGMGGGADPKAACQAAYDECMKQSTASDAGTTEQPGDTSTTASELQNCTATVDEVNGCVKDLVAVTKTMMASMNCNAAVSSDGGMSPQTAAPTTCQAIETKCPGVASSNDVGGGEDTETSRTDGGGSL